jgi:KaiC/GvpD/RAD55 family RecA-like ATPase
MMSSKEVMPMQNDLYLHTQYENLVEIYFYPIWEILILVSEKFGSSPTTLDYMVDGVVTLSRLTMDHRNARELELEKLRGVRINQPRYPFTLEGGRFQYIEPSKRKSVEKN